MPGAVLRTVQAAVVARPVTSILRESASYHLPERATDQSHLSDARPARNTTPKHRPHTSLGAVSPKPPTPRSSSGLLSTEALDTFRLPLLLQWGLQIEEDPRLQLRTEGATTIAFWSSALFTLRYPLMSATIDLEPNTVVKAVKGPPLPMYSWRTKSPNARLVYTRSTDEANIELGRLQPGPLGFDMEWKPNFVVGQTQNPVALVQLANDEVVLLLQVSAMTAFPAKLREVLGDSSYVKAGVSIKNDVEKLYRDYGIVTRNCVELAYLARTVDNPRWNGSYRSGLGLNTLCEAYQEASLQKGKITRSNWELMLTEAQQHYAANDSHSGYTLYRILAAMAAAMSPAPLLTWYSFDFVGSALDSETGMAWVPDNPNYDPGPPRVRVVREDDDHRRKRKGRKGGADGPTASNVSTNSETGSATARGPRVSGHGHQPLFKPPPHIGPSRYVTSIRSPGQQPDDVPLFVSRDSPDYEKYRSLGETSQNTRPSSSREQQRGPRQAPAGYEQTRPDDRPPQDGRGERGETQMRFGLKRSSTDSPRFERGEPPAQRTRSSPGRPYPPRPQDAREPSSSRPPSPPRGRGGPGPSPPPPRMEFGIRRPSSPTQQASSREPFRPSHDRHSSSYERRPVSYETHRRPPVDERPPSAYDRREDSRERSGRDALPHRSVSPPRRPQFGLRPQHTPGGSQGHIGPGPAGGSGGADGAVDGPGHHRPTKPRWKKGRPSPA